MNSCENPHPGKEHVYTDVITGRSLYTRYSGKFPEERTEILIYDLKSDRWTSIELPYYVGL